MTSTPPDVLAALDRVLAAADARQHTAAFARRLEQARAAATGDTVRLVVAGEAKRGKSALVNALAGAPGLVPVDVDVCTATHVVLRYAECARAAAVDAGGVQHEIELVDIAAWARRDGVQQVELAIPSPLLATGLVLVDTPGVGGLVAGHARVTLAALSSAHAMLFVLDAGTPITRPELDFLAEAATRIDTVVLVVTHADLYPPADVARNLEDTRRLVAARVTRLAQAPLLAVSSTVHEALAAGGDPRDESGFGALTDLLRQQVVDRAARVRLAALLRTALSAVQAARYVDSLVVHQVPASTVRAQLAEQDVELRRLQAAGAEWGQALGDAMQHLRLDAESMLARQQADIRRRGDERLETYQRGMREDVGDDLAAEIRALAVDLGRLLDQRAEQVAVDLCAQHLLPALAPREAGALEAPALTADLERVRPDLQQLWFAQMPMLSVERLLTAAAHALPLGVGATLLGPVGLMTGALVGVTLLRGRLRQAEQAKARELVRTMLAEAVGELRLQTQRRIFQLQTAIREGLRQGLRERVLAVEAARAALATTVKAEQDGRSRALEQVQARLAALLADQRILEQALADCTSSPAPSPALTGKGLRP